jgi:hypothetical protein
MCPLVSATALPKLASAFATVRLLPIKDTDTNIEKLTLHHRLASRQRQAASHLPLRPTITKITNVRCQCQDVQVKGMPEVSDTCGRQLNSALHIMAIPRSATKPMDAPITSANALKVKSHKKPCAAWSADFETSSIGP